MAMHTVVPPQRISAEVFFRSMTRGRNGAVLLGARIGDELVEWVVKLSARLTQPPLEHVLELLANLVGQALGMDVGVPALVDIDRDFAESIAEPSVRADALRSLGPHYGSRLVVGLTQMAEGLELSASMRTKASELLAFDVMIHNFDRRRVNPNLLVGRDRIFAFDHGDAFAFLYPTFGTLPTDPADDPLVTLIEQHAFGATLKGRLADLSTWRQALAALTDTDLAHIAAQVPAEWRTAHVSGAIVTIMDVLKRRRDRVATWLRDVELWVNR